MGCQEQFHHLLSFISQTLPPTAQTDPHSHSKQLGEWKEEREAKLPCLCSALLWLKPEPRSIRELCTSSNHRPRLVRQQVTLKCNSVERFWAEQVCGTALSSLMAAFHSKHQHFPANLQKSREFTSPKHQSVHQATAAGLYMSPRSNGLCSQNGKCPSGVFSC